MSKKYATADEVFAACLRGTLATLEGQKTVSLERYKNLFGELNDAGMTVPAASKQICEERELEISELEASGQPLNQRGRPSAQLGEIRERTINRTGGTPPSVNVPLSLLVTDADTKVNVVCHENQIVITRLPV